MTPSKSRNASPKMEVQFAPSLNSRIKRSWALVRLLTGRNNRRAHFANLSFEKPEHEDRIAQVAEIDVGAHVSNHVRAGRESEV